MGCASLHFGQMALGFQPALQCLLEVTQLGCRLNLAGVNRLAVGLSDVCVTVGRESLRSRAIELMLSLLD